MWYNLFMKKKEEIKPKKEVVKDEKKEVKSEYDPNIPENKQRWLR